MPFLTEVEYQNICLHFHWLLDMTGSFMGSWRKLALRETLPRIDVRRLKLVCYFQTRRMNAVYLFKVKLNRFSAK